MTSRLSLWIEAEEGVRFFVFDDATGHFITKGDTLQGNPTVGIGRCLSTRGITQGEAYMLLENDLAALELKLSVLPWFNALDNVRRDVIRAMAFQMGVGGMLQFKSMIADIEAGHYTSAATSMMTSQWAKETPARANRTAAIMRTGAYPTSGLGV